MSENQGIGVKGLTNYRSHSYTRLPFDPEQLEIPGEDRTSDFPQQPQGFINNDPRQNNPLVAGGGKGKASEKLRVEPVRESAQGS